MKISKKTLMTSITALTIAGTSFTVSANKGHDDCESDSASLVQEATVGADQAIKIALAEMPGKVIEAEIEQDDGVIVWEVEVVNSENKMYEFEIDAKSGAILESKLDND